MRAAVEFKTRRKYWGLVRELAAADFKLKYQGSVFGYLWSLMKPLAIFGVLYLVFSVFVRIGSDIPNYPVYLLLGIVLWNYFAESTVNGMRAIVDKGDLIRKVYFPRIMILLASSLSALITLVLNLLIVAVFLLFAHTDQSWQSFGFLFLILELYLLSVGISLFLGALFVRFRDFAYIWEVALQLLFYASAIIYPLSLVPERFQKLLVLSPITQIVQDARWLLVSKQTTTGFAILAHWALIPYLIPPLLAITGYIYFERAASMFAEDV
jgi:ABC-2 type transport system permease protein